MSQTTDDVPSAIRRLDTDRARRLARLVEGYDDLQTVLRCCERLLSMLGGGREQPDDVGVEALWTLALLSYARAFAPHDGVFALTDADLPDQGGPGEALRRHQVLLHLRDHHADPSSNPREVYTVGVAQDASGAVNAVAVTSAPAPLLDEGAVRQAGATALALCAVLDERINPLQEVILAEARDTPAAALAGLDLIEVGPVG